MEAKATQPHNKRKINFFSDIFALNTFCYIISLPIELGFAQMSFSTHLHTRFIGLFIITTTARPFGIWRDWIFKKFKISNEDKGIKPYLVDTLAYLSFEMPLYITNLTISGASLEQMIKSILFFAFIAGMVGRPYGIYRNFIRCKIFKLDSSL
ncbi:L-alanine exporter AlaE [Xenorhabdus bovienii]|uniref:L-alanine exporter AlaE n=1 Tax=Xenorhabdus bovienii TaxID=40576 RepID=A0AAJ1JAV7_XENBV|nr:L-alanine exporter AlaE [Xenorhabdus bovienii]MDE1476380.1 L-alanine exporter AlaE [Xenorhabdus bovienii]MDE1480379.1 L-alanine exporter AlaE [Xenorhabdus bovienii]MDE1488469.1 L-alanine exporter AlaE [Xenorhabdus bovienii]MDE1493004.1 L-alanine exporter AlaE [Xenorhabdus bovienii]MDE9434102.1 L-alanine exporter AlaE [Xenorhabdus bovienii]